MTVSVENCVGLIVAPLRINDSVMVPQSRADCTPESEEYHLTWGIRSRTERARPLCSTATLQQILGSYFCADPKPTVNQTQVAEDHAVYGIADEDRISYLVDLTQQITLIIERELKLAGFWESIPARNKLKAEIQKTLLAPEFAKVPDVIKNRAHIISRVMEIAEKNNDIILFAD